MQHRPHPDPWRDMADAALVLRARAGQAPALAELFGRWFRAARASAYAASGDAAAAEDAAIEAMGIAFQQLDTLEDPAAFGPWLRTIARRRAIALGRRAPPTDELGDLPDPHDPARAHDDAEQRALVRAAVDALPDPLREAVVLHELEGYPVATAARFLDVPEGTLKRRLFDARAALARTLRHRLEGRGPQTPSQRADAALREALDELEHDPTEAFLRLQQALALGRLSRRALDEAQTRVCAQASAALAARGLQGPLAQWLAEHCSWSPASLDIGDAQGQAAAALSAATTEFPLWEPPIALVVRSARLMGGAGLPPPPHASPPVAWSLRARATVLEADGGVADPAAMVREAASPAMFFTGIASLRQCDALQLWRLGTSAHQLVEVEQLVRGIAATLAPKATVLT
ncbi:MAG: RNA polymerase sigma factor, partial [Deltaproteobacteria bacterium]|nr:RNA polymerase sigma factor [Deltaproteobacteria bacterium]